jgi:hypothetical protein
MKVEYLPDASLIRIMDFTREELRNLRRAFVRLARGSKESISLCAIDDIQCMNDIDLRLERSTKDVGINARDSIGRTLYCRLSRDGWLEANGKAKAIERAIGAATFNWLNEDGDISLLLSWSGQW